MTIPGRDGVRSLATAGGLVASAALAVGSGGAPPGSYRVVQLQPGRDGVVALSGNSADAREQAAAYMKQQCPNGFDVVQEGENVTGSTVTTEAQEMSAPVPGTPFTYAGGEAKATTRDTTEWRIHYRCRSVSAETAAAEPKKPAGGGGFRLGASRDETKAICTGAQLRYEAGEADASCSGTPVDLGAPGHAQLTYCSDALCEIEVVLDPSPALYLDTFRSLRDKLQDKYGKARSMKRDTERCRAEAAACIAAGDASFAYEWRWSTGHSISLVSRAIDGKACIVVSYAAPERAARKPGPAL